MTPLPGALGGKDLIAWRLDQKRHADTWDSGEGAFQVGGRWNSAGSRVVYCAIDPATAILEVAVHKTFRALDVVPHVMTALKILDPSIVHIVWPDDVPNPNWLHPGSPSAGQQAFGDELVRERGAVVLPSVVSTHSWNLIFDPVRIKGRYQLVQQKAFALDGRLHPAVAGHP